MERTGCQTCPLPDYERSATQTAFGHQLTRVAGIDSALRAGFQIDLNDVSARDLTVLGRYRNECSRYEQEVMEERQRNQKRG